MKIIKLTQGQVTFVDDDVYEWASKFEWHARKNGRQYYAARASLLKLGPRQRIFLHREIKQSAEGFEVGHKDGNGLNNLRENLQDVTHAQNMQGKQLKKPNATSRFRGVCRYKSSWVASCGMKGVRYYLGSFQDELEAAKAYDSKARELFSEHAACNFSLDKQPTIP